MRARIAKLQALPKLFQSPIQARLTHGTKSPAEQGPAFVIDLWKVGPDTGHIDRMNAVCLILCRMGSIQASNIALTHVWGIGYRVVAGAIEENADANALLARSRLGP